MSQDTALRQRANRQSSARDDARKREQQISKLKELRRALVEHGLVSLGQQAEALGLTRSSTWALLQCNHKSSGLRAVLIAKILKAPKLPAAARTILLEYIAEKSQGVYGHNEVQRKRFIAQLHKLGLGSCETSIAPFIDVPD